MKFLKNENGFGNIIYGAVGLVIFLILITSIILPTVTTVNTTYDCMGKGGVINASCAWGASSIAMWGILPIVIIAGAILFVIGKK